MTEDPFAATPAADPAEFNVSKSARRPKKYIDPLGDSSKKPKKENFNPRQQKWFEKHGYTWANVEKKNYYGGVANDLFGFADFLAVTAEDTLLVQTTSQHNALERIKKSESKPELMTWLLKPGRRFEVHGWEQRGRFWHPRRTEIRLGRDGYERVVIEEE